MVSYVIVNYIVDIIVEINLNLELFLVVYIFVFNGSDFFIMVFKEYIQDVLIYFGLYNDSVVVGYVCDVFGLLFLYYIRDYLIMKFGNKLVKLEYFGNIINDSVLVVDLRFLLEFVRESNFSVFYWVYLKEYLKVIFNILVYINCVIFIYWCFFGKWYIKFRIEVLYLVWIYFYVSWENEISYYIGWILYNMIFCRFYGQVCRMFYEFVYFFVGEFLDENFQFFEGMDYYLDEIKKELLVLIIYDIFYYGFFFRYFNELLIESIVKYVVLKCGIFKDYMIYLMLLMLMYFFLLFKFFEEYDVVWKINSILFQYVFILVEYMRMWVILINISIFYWEFFLVIWDYEWNIVFYYGWVVIVFGLSE